MTTIKFCSRKFFGILVFLLTLSTSGFSQIYVEGYAYETGNRGFLNQVNIGLYDSSGQLVSEGTTGADGKFIMLADIPGTYVLKAEKEVFHPVSIDIDISQMADGEKKFVKLEMKRSPGYILEVTLAKKRDDAEIPVDGMKGALIEVYNNTTREEVMVLKDFTAPDFKVNLVKGNHYTILVRKEGYLNKKMEAFVDVEDCILCLEGFGTVEPGVSDNLSENNQMGTLLANVEMEPVFKGKKIELEHIYYDFGKWDIRPDAAIELNKVGEFLVNNPRLSVELGAHTDSRGGTEANMSLSKRRARSAVNYLIRKVGVAKDRISWQGYGETQLVNHCANGVECEESEHDANRRTELKVVGISDNIVFKTLAQIKQEEQMEELILDLQNQEQVKLEDVDETEDLQEYLDKITDEEPEVQETTDDNTENIVETEAVLDQEEESQEPDAVEELTIGDVEREEKNLTTTLSDLKEAITQRHLANFSAYTCLIRNSTEPLNISDSLFKTHGKALLEYNNEDGEYLYLIGKFENYVEANEYLTKTLKLMYSDAELVRFENSKLVK